jgi:hypothetical protein
MIAVAPVLWIGIADIHPAVMRNPGGSVSCRLIRKKKPAVPRDNPPHWQRQRNYESSRPWAFGNKITGGGPETFRDQGLQNNED